MLPDPSIIQEVVARALREDIETGDVTTLATVAPDLSAKGKFVARERGVLAGYPIVREVFRQLSGEFVLRTSLTEGAQFEAGAVIAEIDGPARALLTGERVALNYLQRLCGIATLTSRFVDAIEGTGARIVDTRKTTPGLRALEKYAVTIGGGRNHRTGLYDAVMIKDNHIVAARGITSAVERARAAIPHTMTVTVECENLGQVDEALAAGADVVLLDNMDNAMRIEAVRRAKGRALTEASGGITLDNVAEVARTGVDIISVGALTHSAPAIDISMELIPDVR